MRARQFAAAAQVLYVYADPSGRFETTRDRGAIPASSRRVVRVIEPTVSRRAAGDHDRVYIVDISGASASSAATATVVARRVFKRRAVAALPIGRTSVVEPLGAPDVTASLEPHGDVIVYGTRWCGACKQTTAFLAERGVAYIEKDVETDVAAAAELLAKTREAGISADRVPIIDVRGEALMVGFVPVRLSTLIGDPT